MRIPLIMMLVLAVGTLLIDGYNFWFISRTYPARRKISHTYMWTAILCWVYLIVILSMPRRSGSVSILPVMWMLYSYLTIYIAKLTFAVITAIMLIPRLWHMHWQRISIAIATPVAVAVFLIAWWGALVGRREIQVQYYNMVSPKVPSSFNGYRIVQFSDAHVGTWGNDTTFISQLVDSINALKPNLIVFTGDIVNRQTSEIEPFVNILSRLKAPDGVYSILGNHDYGMYCEWENDAQQKADHDRLLAIQKDMGWRLLNNEHVFLTRGPDSIALIGVENWGEPPFGQIGDLDKAYPADSTQRYHQRDSLFKLLLSHNPEHWRQIVSDKSNIDLTLSGHTHAMQFIVSLGKWRWSPSQFKYEEWGGPYTKLNKHGEPVNIYVNIGSGEVGMPFRIGADPELTVITLSSPSK